MVVELGLKFMGFAASGSTFTHHTVIDQPAGRSAGARLNGREFGIAERLEEEELR